MIAVHPGAQALVRGLHRIPAPPIPHGVGCVPITLRVSGLEAPALAQRHRFPANVRFTR
jgi:hypothetical protein